MGGKLGEKGEIPMPAGFSGVFVRFRKRGERSFWPNDRQQWLLESLNPGCRIPKHTLNKATLVSMDGEGGG